MRTTNKIKQQGARRVGFENDAQNTTHTDRLKKAETIHEKTERAEYMANRYKSTTSSGTPLVVSSILVLILIRLVGGGRGMSRRGSVSVPLVVVSGLQVLVLVALGQAFRETGLLQDLGGSRSSHRELGRDVGLGRGREVGECVSHRLLVNNGRGESAFDGVGLKASVSPTLRLWVMDKEYPYPVNDIRLNPNTGVGGRDNFDIGLGDNVRAGLLDRVRFGQSRRINRDTGTGDGDGQSLGVYDVESLCLDIDLGHSVVDCGRDGLKLPRVTNHSKFC